MRGKTPLNKDVYMTMPTVKPSGNVDIHAFEGTKNKI